MLKCSKAHAALAFVALVIGVGSSPVRAQKPAKPVPIPKLDWQACADSFQRDFLCATAQVPMDYAKPQGQTFSLALIKAPAQDPAKRIGSLFWNPGGPGDAGTQYLPHALVGFPEPVRRRFDIISWDPRGMGGGSRPVVQCFDTARQEAEKFAELFSQIPDIPASETEIAAYLRARTTLNQLCVSHAGNLLAHVSTADTARDLDLLRQTVGEEKIYYYGTSYGTFLGATYLNMFPKRIKAAVLDGAVGPREWSGNDGDGDKLSTFIRVGSDYGTVDTTREFMVQCGKVQASVCKFSAGSPEATLRKWDELLQRARANPLKMPDGYLVSDRSLLAYMSGKTYTLRRIPIADRFPGWYAVGEFLNAATTFPNAEPSAIPPNPPNATGPAAKDRTYITSYGRQFSVICGESPNPTSEKAQVEQALVSFKRSGLNVWPFAATCSGWTARASRPYLGPWNHPTPPVLVIGNTFDPATPYSSSKRMAEELANGRLLTVEGLGHTELLNPSQCAKDYIAAYLIDGKLPPENARCRQEGVPFPKPN